MARKSKSVYSRIEETKNEIQQTEKVLQELNDELQTLFKEKDDLEMKKLFEHMKSNNLTLDKAMELLNLTQ